VGDCNENGRGEVEKSFLMKRNIILYVCVLFSALNLSAQSNTSIKSIYSQIVKDSFDIYVTLPASYKTDKTYDIVYYCDANLKSGKELRRQVMNGKDILENKNLIFVGIGHIGDYHQLRRRDFILPFISDNDTIPKSNDYGHINDFYLFLTSELDVQIQSTYSCSWKRTIIGHSLGGLFAIYCLFQNNNFFTNYIALSPALWVNNYSIYNFNKISDSLHYKSYLYLSAGSGETINRILPGAAAMNKFLKEKKYTNLELKYKVHKGKTHNSQVPESLKEVLPIL